MKASEINKVLRQIQKEKLLALVEHKKSCKLDHTCPIGSGLWKHARTLTEAMCRVRITKD